MSLPFPDLPSLPYSPFAPPWPPPTVAPPLPSAIPIISAPIPTPLPPQLPNLAPSPLPVPANPPVSPLQPEVSLPPQLPRSTPGPPLTPITPFPSSCGEAQQSPSSARCTDTWEQRMVSLLGLVIPVVIISTLIILAFRIHSQRHQLVACWTRMWRRCACHWCSVRLRRRRAIRSVDVALPPYRWTSSTSMECTLCLESYSARDRIRAFPCGHQYHASCIDRWILTKLEQELPCTCPLCKMEVSIGPVPPVPRV
mmetsp:Transcript_16552/g.35502  ORF Transcript_16552/g.35502 Transcript_16552/m.35502 type:complete len:254 (+) Transcript_16552:389-1150(+)